jgi:hypothetical protein
MLKSDQKMLNLFISLITSPGLHLGTTMLQQQKPIMVQDTLDSDLPHPAATIAYWLQHHGINHHSLQFRYAKYKCQSNFDFSGKCYHLLTIVNFMKIHQPNCAEALQMTSGNCFGKGC